MVETEHLESRERQQLATASTVMMSPKYRMLAGATSAVRLIAGVGLMALQSWACWLVLIIAAISVLWLVWTLFIGSINWVILFFGLFWNGFMLWYFLRPGVKAQFQK